jgi:hypothetical protein
MLFLNPDYIGKGLGRQLIDFAFSNFDIRYVDVNEQNPKATEFYQKIDSKSFDRSEKDDLGKPYPILKMKLKKIEKMYRIISGKWKAKKIAAPKISTRPTTDFLAEALFSIIDNKYDLEFCSVLDLFAGIGSITLEFASRDCKDITAVELNQNMQDLSILLTTWIWDCR